jgi:recombinational DNA repair ATPase RecF
MSSYITIELKNFKFWYDKIITLQEGINYFSGESGSGKSTINKSIYFTLYGGRKFKNIQHRDHKNEPTSVSIFFNSSIKKWKIVRTRPSETITVEIQDSNGYFKYNGDGAQDWINREFGIENIWLSASYISRKKPHFLIDASNNDKMELLQHIAYGDSSLYNQPEYYLSVVKNQINTHNEKFKQCNDNIIIYQRIKISLFNKNPNLSIYNYISEEEMNKYKEQLILENKNLENMRVKLVNLQTKYKFNKQLSLLPIYNETQESINEKVNMIKIKKSKLILKDKLVNFDTDILTTDIDKLDKDHYLYNFYQSKGWNNNICDINYWLDDMKNKLELWHKQQSIELKNKEIEESNQNKTIINNSLITEYKRNLDYYNMVKNEIELYNKQKDELYSKLNSDYNLESINIEIEKLNNMLMKIDYQILLINFDIRCKEIDKNIILKDSFLYEKYETYGWKYNINLNEWLDNIKNDLNLWNEQQNNISKNKDIESSNNLKTELYNSQIREYNNNLENYHKILQSIDEYNNIKTNIETKFDMYKDYSKDESVIKSVIQLNNKKIQKITLYRSIVNFNDKCLTVDKNEIEYYIKIYNKYIDYNWNSNRESIQDWLKGVQRDKELAKLEKEKELKNIEISNTIKLNSKINEELILEYNKRLSEINLYNKSRESIYCEYEEVQKINYIKFDDSDDMTSNWIIPYKAGIKLNLNELICPNCNHGLIYNGNKLELGNIKNECSKEKYKQILLSCDEEYNKRLRKESIISKKEIFDSSEKPILEIPTEPNLLEIPKILEISPVNNSYNNLDITEIPKYSYDECYNILNSYTLIDQYKQYKNIDIDIDLNNSIDEIYNINDKLNKVLELVYEKQKFDKLSKPNNPIKPEEPSKLILDELIIINNISKPELNTFDLPFYSYNDCFKILKSYDLIDIYDKYIKININVNMSKEDILNKINYLKYQSNLYNQKKEFDNIIPKVLPEIPIEPKLIELEKLIKYQNISKPNIEFFDKPIYNYDKYKTLILSKNLIEDYKKYKDINIEVNETFIELDFSLNELNKMSESLKDINREREKLINLISSLPEDDNNIEEKITNSINCINQLNNLIILANDMAEVKKVDNFINQLNNELTQVVNTISDLNYFYNQTEELGIKELEKRISNINGPLKEILDDLFNEQINVKISPYKELKNGNNKLQINFKVEHRTTVVNDITDDFSDGEEGRLSIGLLLALSRTNNNPFIIIDEVLSSMDQPKQEIVLNMLPKWANDKFIISICHNMSEGNSDNIIYF